MKIKTGDKVMIIAGKDKGKIGEVLSVRLKDDKVLVSGVNMVTKHNKPTQNNPEGSITTKEGYVHVSNVAYYDAKKKATFKLGYQFDENGNKVRFLKKNNQVVEVLGDKKKK